MEDGGIGDKKLLAARSDEGRGKICGRMRPMSKDEEQNRGTGGKLKLSEVPQKTWSHLTVDFITKLPVVAGKDAVLVVLRQVCQK